MRILIIDDDEDCLMAMKDMLCDEHVICGLQSAEEALAMLAVRPFDLLILDENLPGMSGKEMLPIVRQRWPRLPVIMVSGYLGGDEAPALAAAGVRALFLKPLDVRSFMTTVAQFNQSETANGR